MFGTIKAKINALTVSILLILSILMGGLSLLNYHNNKALIVRGNQYSIENFTQQLRHDISRLEDNVVTLSQKAEQTLDLKGSDQLLESVVLRQFNYYSDSLGGGIWFRPYMYQPDRRLKAIYALHSSDDPVRLDPGFETDDYNYPMQRWYLEILPRLSRPNTVVWTTPYHDQEGSETLMTTVGSGIYHHNRLIGMATVDWPLTDILKTISNMKPTPNSFVLFADPKNDFVILTTDPYLNYHQTLGRSLRLIPWYNDNLNHNQPIQYHKRVYLPYVKHLPNGMLLVVNIPTDELFGATRSYIRLVLGLLLLSCILIAIGVYFILHHNIHVPMLQLIKMANQIGRGNLNTHVQITAPSEFAKLSQTLNQMTHDLKLNLKKLTTISNAKEKIEAELSVARQIQVSALPHNFPLHTAFDMYATMTPAKDVGGDFYDVFMVDDNHLAFVMADVSGKGVTAALVMMSAKTMIRNVLMNGYRLKQVATKVNQGLCDNNAHGMFVTAFIGVLDLRNGLVQYVNAGHCPPVIRCDNHYVYIRPVANLVLGVLPDFDYQICSVKLNPNDRIFLYTDGVTEAQNKVHKLYGPERLLECLNDKEGSPKQILENVHQSLHKYAAGTEQSDDITMMEILYYGFEKQAQNFVSDIQSWPKVTEFLRKNLSLSKQKLNTVLLVAEEIFTNISKYAYADTGAVRVVITQNKKDVTITFMDWGRAYNPIKYRVKGIHQSAGSRAIGGLGIYMVQKMVNHMDYIRNQGKNILKIQIKKGNP